MRRGFADYLGRLQRVVPIVCPRQTHSSQLQPKYLDSKMPGEGFEPWPRLTWPLSWTRPNGISQLHRDILPRLPLLRVSQLVDHVVLFKVGRSFFKVGFSFSVRSELVLLFKVGRLAPACPCEVCGDNQRSLSAFAPLPSRLSALSPSILDLFGLTGNTRNPFSVESLY